MSQREKSLIFLNPNASEEMTAAMRQTLSPFDIDGLSFRCVTSEAGPAIIETQHDLDSCVPPMLALAAGLEHEAVGFVVACFSDPGILSLREMTSLPVVGMQESSVSVALSLGRRFGIIAMAPASVQRQRRSIATATLSKRWAGSRALNHAPGDYSDFESTLDAMVETGRALRDDDGADVVILGCAGMAGFRRPLEDTLQLPVVDPVEAAASLLMGRVLVDRAANSTRLVSSVG